MKGMVWLVKVGSDFLSWDSILKRNEHLEFSGKDKNFSMTIRNHPRLEDWDFTFITAKVFTENQDTENEFKFFVEEVVVEGELEGFTENEEEVIIDLKESLSKDEIEIEVQFSEKGYSTFGYEFTIFLSKANIDLEFDFQNTEEIKKAYCTLDLTYSIA